MGMYCHAWLPSRRRAKLDTLAQGLRNEAFRNTGDGTNHQPPTVSIGTIARTEHGLRCIRQWCREIDVILAESLSAITDCVGIPRTAASWVVTVVRVPV